MSFIGSGGQPPYEFRSLGGLPAGLSLGLRGELSGTPEAVGSFTVTVGFMDANGREMTGTYSLDVVAPTAIVFGARTRDFVATRQQLLARSIDLPGLRDRRDPAPFDVWIDGMAGWHAGSDAGSGGFGVTGIGADYLVNDRLLLGLALYGDWMRAGTANSETSGTGVLAGPYASIGLGDAMTLDLSLLLRPLLQRHLGRALRLTLCGQLRDQPLAGACAARGPVAGRCADHPAARRALGRRARRRRPTASPARSPFR